MILIIIHTWYSSRLDPWSSFRTSLSVVCPVPSRKLAPLLSSVWSWSFRRRTPTPVLSPGRSRGEKGCNFLRDPVEDMVFQADFAKEYSRCGTRGTREENAHIWSNANCYYECIHHFNRLGIFCMLFDGFRHNNLKKWNLTDGPYNQRA